MFDSEWLELLLILLLVPTLIAGIPMAGIIIGYLLGRIMPTVGTTQGVVIGLVMGSVALIPYFVLIIAVWGQGGSDTNLVMIHLIGYGASAVMTTVIIWLMALMGILFRK